MPVAGRLQEGVRQCLVSGIGVGNRPDYGEMIAVERGGGLRVERTPRRGLEDDAVLRPPIAVDRDRRRDAGRWPRPPSGRLDCVCP